MSPSYLHSICMEIYSDVLQTMSWHQKLITVRRALYAPLHLLLTWIPNGSGLVDIGCGTGTFIYLANRLRKIKTGLGIDKNAQSIRLANSVNKEMNICFKVSDGHDKLNNKRYFNCVSCIDIFHHIKENEKDQFLSSIASIVPIGGRLIFKDLDIYPRWKNIANRITDYLSTRSIVSYRSRLQIETSLKKLGFEILESKRCDMLVWSHYFIIADKIRNEKRIYY